MTKPLDLRHSSSVQQKLDMKTKPLGSLGKLESLAKQLVLILSQGMSDDAMRTTKFSINNPSISVFAGDHGIASEGVSIAPSEVTGQMVANFAQGGAAICVLARQLGWQFNVVDCGILTPQKNSAVIDCRLGNSTAAFHLQPAMTNTQLEQGLVNATALVEAQLNQGCNLFAFGEMGIGNTTSAAAIFSALSGIAAEFTVGAGTGVSGEVVQKKRQLIEQALLVHQLSSEQPLAILRCLGGFEIVHIVGAMLAVASAQKVIVVDGFIASAAAMLAVAIEPNSKDYMVFAHCSSEQGHQKMLDYLAVEPLLNLGMRLGEGSGAALALPIIQSALAIYNDMASFEDAGVTQVVK
ncbi:nicotinate-nucleotide--dimethylbenzimidazole phosphoribosyltransferase [Pseudoalteromonas luteoviolacea]|uniref:Nicotinate-nucleotide--dimethylbenzimidazole phosphoribosyltransferase n=1 Tax=Pseudoalteromonas luteoviolacea TaxID=43657 RepID=A0A1C0TNV4_9GAMM|nr:nicotinate-nucleotide--dimethylbenzimidazole phosphoribosyltransferase [Pseudoalteromonas luteoviolacea]MBQ4813594.1 nicotinate-nucleotide--dimethylbenzimidazole phosphoribosyltransferase [Pseudoalteromonas luteoviolacea]OCQ20546.1 nicotinate-nucleotide--dimethylbenzimidazole phosphoribosyltransferase [Pseudoalteromonas luteoviolacea]